MSVSNDIAIQNAAYLDGYRISILFNNGKNKIVDFSPFVTNNNKAALSKYKILSNFKKFEIGEGNIVWGKNWDLIFPVYELYQGKIKN
ncbi:MAG: DUF2442 domain-containing protein [Rhizobacter sp.]|nr:DUF2442 domain-containing protein [Ferruginibacter sp.]